MAALAQDRGRRCGPHEWTRVVVVLTEKAQDGANELVDTPIGAPANLLAREFREPAFDEIEPG